MRNSAPQFDILYLGLPETPAAALESMGAFGCALRAVQRADATQPEFAAVPERAARAVRPLIGESWRQLAAELGSTARNHVISTGRRMIRCWSIHRAL